MMGEGNLVIGVGKNKAETVMVSSSEIVGAAKATTVGGGYQLTVGGVKNESVAVGSWEEVGQTKVTVVGHKYEIVCGKSRILMERDGTITMEGTKLIINESDKMIVKAGRIDLN
jgi:type VI secretion system secreted protein VgrG